MGEENQYTTTIAGVDIRVEREGHHIVTVRVTSDSHQKEALRVIYEALNEEIIPGPYWDKHTDTMTMDRQETNMGKTFKEMEQSKAPSVSNVRAILEKLATQIKQPKDWKDKGKVLLLRDTASQDQRGGHVQAFEERRTKPFLDVVEEVLPKHGISLTEELLDELKTRFARTREDRRL